MYPERVNCSFSFSPRVYFTHFQLDMRLLANRYMSAYIRVLLMPAQELVTTYQYLLQPFEYIRVVNYLVLDHLLRDGEQYLRTGNVGGKKQTKFTIYPLQVWKESKKERGKGEVNSYLTSQKVLIGASGFHISIFSG